MTLRGFLIIIGLTSISLTGCVDNTGTENQKNVKKDTLSKLHSISTVIKKETNISESKKLLEELSKNYSNKYTCDIAPESTILGDINGDGVNDILFRYMVDDIENQTWVACGWLIAFGNNSNEYDSYIFFDWSSGPCSRTQFDLGFPSSINDGVISSSIDDYAEDDACCCPSIKREMKFNYDKEFQLLSLLNIKTIK
jgi:hypothetical protein